MILPLLDSAPLLPLTLVEDRGILVPPGQHIVTGYARIDRCRMACRDRMAVGDVELAHRRLIQTAPNQPWPCPVGYWSRAEGDFIIVDGRHAYVAALMIGYEWLLVAWTAELPQEEK